MTTQPARRDTAAGVTVPGTTLARDATELVRASTTDLIYHHSRRVFWFASLQGRNRGLSFDPELLTRRRAAAPPRDAPGTCDARATRRYALPAGPSALRPMAALFVSVMAVIAALLVAALIAARTG